MRKRRHSNSERIIKRIIKSQSNTPQQSDVIMSPRMFIFLFNDILLEILIMIS